MLRFIRIWLPAIVTLAGVLVMVLGRHDSNALDGGAGIVGAGLSIWLLNVLFRVGVDGEADRADEDAARVFFDRHGHWPDEAPPADPPGRAVRSPPAGPEAGPRAPRPSPHRDGGRPAARRARPRRPG